MKTYKKLFSQITKEVKNHQKQKDYSKFKKIDAHEHITEEADFEKFLEVMDYFNIEKTFLMPTGKDYQRENFALKLQEKYPDKIIAFAFLDGTGNLAEEHLKKSIQKGAKGLKLLFWHPNIYIKDKIRMDSESVYKLFEICNKAKIPVLAHMSFANFPEHKEQLENALKKFPKLIFIIPHYLGAAPKLNIVAEMLDKYPNLYTDISMGGGKNRYVAFIQGFRKRFRNFFKKYHNRLFWGTDFFISKKSSVLTKFYYQRIKHDINMLDEKFFYSPFYEENRYLRGLNLADWILENVFYNNAKKVLLKGGER